MINTIPPSDLVFVKYDDQDLYIRKLKNKFLPYISL